MRFLELIDLGRDLPYFDLSLLAQMTGEQKPHLVVQLHRWATSGRVVSLRRGFYTLSPAYRRVSLSPLALANELCRPSYLSGLWVMSYYDLIPERITAFTSVSSRTTRSFRNEIGLFNYSNVKQDLFWGQESRVIQGVNVSIAAPEKSLLDFWHLNRGEWTLDRMTEMRFQNHDAVDLPRLEAYASRCSSPRLERATECFRRVLEMSGEGSTLP